MTKILTDEADEILLDVREHLGNLIDHPGSEARKEQELQTAFNKIQEIIKLTDKPKGLLSTEKQPALTEGQVKVYVLMHENYEEYCGIASDETDNITMTIRETLTTFSLDKDFIPALRKFLNEVQP